jgi:GAF domain-containing protein
LSRRGHDLGMTVEREAEKARLLLEAARYLSETLDPARVYDRFHELLTDAIHHGGVVVSSYDEDEELIRCDYAWVDGERLDPTIFPPLPLNREGGGMQSRVITTGEPLLVNDVREQVKDPKGVYYDVDREGTLRKVPDEGPPGVRAAMMLPVKHEGRVVGVVQLMTDQREYTTEQLELAEGLVGLMAASVRNARLYQEAQNEAAARARAEATAAEREHAARVLEAVGDGVFLLDDDDFVQLWNRAAELGTGRRRADALGRPVDELFDGWQAFARSEPGRGRLRLPRSQRRATARRGAERLHRHRLPRAANADDRRARRREDALARGHRPQLGAPPRAPGDDRRAGNEADADHGGDPPREQARPG